jgi:hypothetical protein
MLSALQSADTRFFDGIWAKFLIMDMEDGGGCYQGPTHQNWNNNNQYQNQNPPTGQMVPPPFAE